MPLLAGELCKERFQIELEAANYSAFLGLGQFGLPLAPRLYLLVDVNDAQGIIGWC